MDINNIIKLLPEFLEQFKGADISKVQEFIPSLGNNSMLKNLFENSSKYTKYLPLLPVLSKLNEDGFMGLLNNTEDVTAVFNVLSQSDNKYAKLLKDVDVASILKFLPMLSGFFSKNKEDNNDNKTLKMPEKVEKDIEISSTKQYNNPLSAIADIADSEIIYRFNKYIANDLI